MSFLMLSSLKMILIDASLEVQLVLGPQQDLKDITEWLLDNAQALGVGRLPAFRGNQTYVRR